MEAALAGSGRHQWMGQVGSGIGGMGPDRGELASVGDADNGPPDEPPREAAISATSLFLPRQSWNWVVPAGSWVGV